VVHFYYQNSKLWVEEVALQRICEEVGTPVYVYSQRTLQENYGMLEEAFEEIPHAICYALKANANLQILRLLADLGAGADAASVGELQLAIRAGIKPEKIVFGGVGKRDDEITFALKKGVRTLNVESEQELQVINQIATKLGKQAPVNLRVNPDIDSNTHPYIATGLKDNKFGIDSSQAVTVAKLAHSLPGIDLQGLHCHIGSQIVETSPFVKAIQSLLKLYSDLRKEKINLKMINIGGGLGVDYHQVIEEPLPPQEIGNVTPPISAAEFASSLLPLLKQFPCEIILEPGRFVTANAGALITQVLYTKQTPNKKFVIVDTGMNDLLRPSLYYAYHRIVPLSKREPVNWQKVDVVGPICESGDFLAKDRWLPEVQRGDYLAVLSAGAYGYAMASNYNGRLRAPEVLVNGNQFRIIRQRETIEQLLAK